MVHPSPSSSAYPPSPLRASSTPASAPIPITSPPPARSPSLVARHAYSPTTPGSSIPRGSYSRSVSLSTSPGVPLAFGPLAAAAGKDVDASRRRRSSSGLLAGSFLSSAGASTARSLGGHSGSFAGSYEASLLSFRFSTPPSAPVPFVLKLTTSTPLSAKPPAPLCLPFEAHFFPLANDAADQPDVIDLRKSPAQRPPAPPPPESTPSTPYVASVDLSAHFASLPFPTPLPAFPGHAIPVTGQIQIVVSNPTTGNGVKVFVVPYDVRGMPVGHRMVLRQNLFEEQAGDGISGGQRKLRASAVLHICCVASKRPRMSSAQLSADIKLSQSLPLSNVPDDPATVLKFYLHSTIRLVFSALPSATPGDGPAPPTCTRTVVDMGAPTHGPARFVPWVDDDAGEYQALRQMRKVAIKRQIPPLGRAQQQPDFASPSSILGLRPPAESSSFPMPRQAESYVLPPLARDENHDLLPSPSLRASALPPARHDDVSPPLAFAKVRSATQSGRSSPLPAAAEQSELSRRLRSLRVDQPNR